MARITYGAVVTEARGKAGGIVFANNTAGQYVRAKVSGIQPRTPQQLAQRSQLAALAKTWGQLTELQRTAWKQWAAQQRHETRLGMTAAPSGMQAFMKIGMALAAVGLPPLKNPPTNQDPPAITFAGLTAAQTGYIQSTDITDRGSGYTSEPIVVYAGGNPIQAQTASAVIAPTTVASLAIADPGEGYTSPPVISIEGTCTVDATATCTIAAGAVNSITLTNPGAGYTDVPTVFFDESAENASADVTMQPTVITGLFIHLDGVGYQSTPVVNIMGGGGTGARAVATLAFTTTALTLLIHSTPDAEGSNITSVWMTRALPISRQLRERDYVYLEAIETQPTDEVDVTALWQTRFGALPTETGWQIGVRLTVTNVTNGARSGPYVTVLGVQ